MITVEADTLVIGGGAAGLGAAYEVQKNGFRVVIVERDQEPGGVLLQCIHNGFGLHHFKEDLTGPEYAEKWIDLLDETKVEVFTGTAIMSIRDADKSLKECIGRSEEKGLVRFRVRTIVLAMGCRERNRGNLKIPGTRPAGVYTAGLAQKLVNMYGYIPGKDVVILGSGDIGLIMARRMQLVGSKVHAVIELNEFPGGLTRNICQCLNDFDIPLYLSHTVIKIIGKDRVEAVEAAPVENGKVLEDKSFLIKCDTLLLSVGLVPENELSRQAGIIINESTGGPVVDSMMMTNIEGIFAAGNVLHVHDLVDFVSDEASITGKNVVEYLSGRRPSRQIEVVPGKNIKYVNPSKCDVDKDCALFMRPLLVKSNARIAVRAGGRKIKEIRKVYIQPSEMIRIVLSSEIVRKASEDSRAVQITVEVCDE